MRVLLISKALVVGAYQKKAEELARQPGMDLMLAVPPSWKQEGGRLPLERRYTAGYRLVVEPIAFNGRFHVHCYPLLARRFAQFRPELVHVDEEAYNLATFQALLLARRYGARSVFFTWQNLDRHYPPPFSLMERYALRTADGCIAGNEEAARIQQRRGIRATPRVIPQFGVDPDLFRPAARPEAVASGFTIGFAGRLVEQKGLWVLCRAFERLPQDCRLLIAGSGPLEPALRDWSRTRRFGQRVRITSASSTSMPPLYQEMDCLALPSLTTTSWKEQFGRAAVEAMACETPVVGSDSGEIPIVVGDGGLIVPENDEAELARALLLLHDDQTARRTLGRRGRARVLARYTQAQVARQTYELYRQVLAREERAPVGTNSSVPMPQASSRSTRAEGIGHPALRKTA